ncbi:MAG: hypothetical protein LBD14_02745 [Puniceicoccales bacterium]|jgi:hypothetical protein|nr:hypothetical protein [Puniceicoccales bacterium]
MLTLRDKGDKAIEIREEDYVSANIKYLRILDPNNPFVKVVLGPKVENARNKILLWEYRIAKYFADKNEEFAKEFAKEFEDWKTKLPKTAGKTEEATQEQKEAKQKQEKRLKDLLLEDTPKIEFVCSRAPLA